MTTAIPHHGFSYASKMPTGIAWTVAAVLSAAAALKLISLDARTSPWAAVEAAGEALLALWLLSGIAWLWSLRTAAVVFAMFASAAAWTGFAGADSCGCFGSLKANPWLTMAFDLVMVGLLWWGLSQVTGTSSVVISKKRASSRRARVHSSEKVASKWGRAFLIIGSTAVVAATTWRVLTLPGRIDLANGMTQAAGLTILEPEKWVGGSLPIKSHLQPPQDAAVAAGALDQGAWEMVIYHADCDTCRKVVPQVAARATGRTAFVEMPPYGDPLIGVSGKWLSLRLSDQTEWFAQTPIVLQLKDGRVVSVKQGEQAAAVAQQ
jgi:hypothetical protein